MSAPDKVIPETFCVHLIRNVFFFYCDERMIIVIFRKFITLYACIQFLLINILGKIVNVNIDFF
jgi:hypothetical protein